LNSLRMDEIVNALFQKGWAVELKPVPGVPKKGWHGFVVAQDSSSGSVLGICHELQHNKNNGKRSQLADALAAEVGWAATTDREL